MQHFAPKSRRLFDATYRRNKHNGLHDAKRNHRVDPERHPLEPCKQGILIGDATDDSLNTSV